MKLANWLSERRVLFALRQKKDTYIQQQGQDFQQLLTPNLKPGVSLYLTQVQVTKQKGFGKFDLVAYWRRRYRDKTSSEAWYILTNLGSKEAAIAAYRSRFGIEAMFSSCKSGGYNLEDSHAVDASQASQTHLFPTRSEGYEIDSVYVLASLSPLKVETSKSPLAELLQAAESVGEPEEVNQEQFDWRQGELS